MRTQAEKDAYAAGALNYCESLRNTLTDYRIKSVMIPVDVVLALLETLEGLAVKVADDGSDV